MARHPTARSPDPRWWVVLAASLVLAGLTLVSSIVGRAGTRMDASLHMVQASLAIPRGELERTLELETAGETALQRAVGATGEDRSKHLAESIAVAESTANAWTRYKAVAAGLPGEADLAGQYERHYLEAKAIASEILVPIIQANEPAPLPDAQVAAADQDRRDLAALIDLYHRREGEVLASMDRRVQRARDLMQIATRAAVVVVLVAAGIGLRVARQVVGTRRRRHKAAETAAFEGQLIRALELVRDDGDALRIGASAIARVAPEERVSIAVVSVSGTSLTPAVGGLVCGVSAPRRCPALLAGAHLEFSDSDALDTCPALAASGQARCAASCWPISVGGSDAAILQVAGDVGRPPGPAEEVSLVVRRVGERVTIIRAFATFELQATRDPLTGLLNRRSFEKEAAQLIADGRDFSVAFADLDHFKQLNDEHGHDAGDRALRNVARTMRDSLRPMDLVCRWGGEEFVILLPGCTTSEAVASMERMRARLAWAGRDEGRPEVTVSVGVAELEPGESLESVVARADEALLAAKAAGRDRVVVWDLAQHGDVPLLAAAPRPER